MIVLRALKYTTAVPMVRHPESPGYTLEEGDIIEAEEGAGTPSYYLAMIEGEPYWVSSLDVEEIDSLTYAAYRLGKIWWEEIREDNPYGRFVGRYFYPKEGDPSFRIQELPEGTRLVVEVRFEDIDEDDLETLPFS